MRCKQKWTILRRRVSFFISTVKDRRSFFWVFCSFYFILFYFFLLFFLFFAKTFGLVYLYFGFSRSETVFQFTLWIHIDKENISFCVEVTKLQHIPVLVMITTRAVLIYARKSEMLNTYPVIEISCWMS